MAQFFKYEQIAQSASILTKAQSRKHGMSNGFHSLKMPDLLSISGKDGAANAIFRQVSILQFLQNTVEHRFLHHLMLAALIHRTALANCSSICISFVVIALYCSIARRCALFCCSMSFITRSSVAESGPPSVSRGF